MHTIAECVVSMENISYSYSEYHEGVLHTKCYQKKINKKYAEPLYPLIWYQSTCISKILSHVGLCVWVCPSFGFFFSSLTVGTCKPHERKFSIYTDYCSPLLNYKVCLCKVKAIRPWRIGKNVPFNWFICLPCCSYSTFIIPQQLL